MILRNLHWLTVLFFLILGSCAKQVAPTGGPKDTIPPYLKNSIPSHNQINFKGRTIELEFSEMVMLTNPKEQIIIAPTTKNEYEITNKNRRVIIKFEEDLKDSSTYSINFREAIKDVTEKNAAENLQLAFSTGNYIDSLSIKGSVYDLLKGSAPKEATVAIFVKNDTLSIFKHKPSYFTKTDKDGNFRLNNLKPGEYFLYALEDKNRNLLVDSRSEFYGFISKTIILKKDTSRISIPLVKLDARPLKLTSARPYNNYFNIKTGKYLADYQVTFPQGKDSVISCFGEDHANIRVYDTFDADSTLIRFTAHDSIGNSLDTGLYVKFTTRNTTPEKFSMTADPTFLLQDKGFLSITIDFNKPVFILNPDSLLFLIDSINVVKLKSESLNWDHKNSSLKITAKINPLLLKQPEAEENIAKPKSLQPGTPPTAPLIIKNELLIGKGSFLSVDGDTSAHIGKQLRPQKADELSVINLTIQTAETHFIAELLNRDMIPLRKTLNSKSITWEDLDPADYKIRVIIDLNKNGKWDAGNYFKKLEPEPIIYYSNPKSTPPNTTHTKANWVVTVGPILIKY
jgi:uncharacterized protein (DUF2141 family)